MEIKIQEKLIQWILQPLANFMNRFSDKAKEALFTIAGLMIVFANFALVYGNLASVRYLYLYTFDCLMMGFMILSLMTATLRPVPFDKFLFIPWMTVGVFMLIAGVKNNEDLLPDAMLFLVAYPIFHIVAGNAGFHKIIRLLLRNLRISFCIFLVISIFFFPITGRQYAGFFHNTNGLASYLILVFSCGLIDFLSAKRKSPLFWVSLIFIGMSAALIYYTASRTGMLAISTTFILMVILTVFTDKHHFKRTILSRYLPILLSIVLFIPTTLYIFRIPQAISQILPSQTEQPSQPEQPGQPEQSGQPEHPGQATETPPPAASDVLSDIQQANDNKLSLEGRNLNQYSTGRIAIWVSFATHLQFWGHAEKADFYVSETRHYSDAHQTILELAYYCGILAGLGYLLFNLLAGIKSIRYALRRPEDRYALAPFAISLTYGVLSLLAVVYVSFYSMTVFYYFLVQCPLMKRDGFGEEP